MLTRLILCLGMAFILQNAGAEEMSISWYHADFPPGFIESGPMQGDGYENYMERFLRSRLTNYRHIYYTANYSRILKQIRKTDACCVALLRTPERELFIEYSQPTMIALANGVFVLTKRFEEFKPFIDEEGYISIYALFNLTSFRMGVAKGRSYKGGVDEILDKYPDSEKIVIRAGKDVFGGLVGMAAAGHGIDYVIGYPHEIRWLVYSNKTKGEFTFIPIKEMPKYVTSHVGCSKNDWGKEVIARINQVLDGKYHSEYKRRYQVFLPPEAVAIHERYINDVFPNPGGLHAPSN